jgi:hypothetical protein
MFHTIFYIVVVYMVVCFGVVYEYENILVILINIIYLINMKFIVKYH